MPSLVFVLGSFPGGSDSEESACNVGDLDSVPESGRSSGEGNGNPLQYSCLEKAMDRGAWGLVCYSLWGHKELDTIHMLVSFNKHPSVF